MENEDTAASQASFFAAGRLREGALQVTVTEKVTRADLTKLIEKIVDLHGCTGCGLGGLDIRIRPQDLRIKEAFREIENVADVAVLR